MEKEKHTSAKSVSSIYSTSGNARANLSTNIPKFNSQGRSSFDLILVPLKELQVCINCGNSIHRKNRVDFGLDVCLSCNLRVFALEIGDKSQIAKVDRANFEWQIRRGHKPREKNFK